MHFMTEDSRLFQDGLKHYMFHHHGRSPTWNIQRASMHLVSYRIFEAMLFSLPPLTNKSDTDYSARKGSRRCILWRSSLIWRTKIRRIMVAEIQNMHEGNKEHDAVDMYLVQRSSWSLDVFIITFHQARSPSISKLISVVCSLKVLRFLPLIHREDIRRPFVLVPSCLLRAT